MALAKRYAAAHPDTLVITGADHETGGLAVESVDSEDESGEGDSAEDGPFPVAASGREFVIDWTTTGHTGVNVPFTGMGPGAHRLTGTMENTKVYDVMVRAAFGR